MRACRKAMPDGLGSSQEISVMHGSRALKHAALVAFLAIAVLVFGGGRNATAGHSTRAATATLFPGKFHRPWKSS
jgi:hypothetical protein